LADNKIALNAGWDQAVLDAEIKALSEANFDISLTGFDDADLAASMARIEAAMNPGPAPAQTAGGAGSLSREFLIPPFSVLSAREGWWQDRKKRWLDLGIQSEVGRGDNLLQFSDTLLEPDPEKRAAMKAARLPGEVPSGLVYGAMNMADGSERTITGTSIFDPVLCEIAYRWFSPKGGIVLDPFAGGSVRGIVAAALGRRYIGIDLRDEQIEANEAQWQEIAPRLPDIEGADHPEPDWRAGDSAKLLPMNRDEAETELADFIFSCPPYGDLEVYSDRPDDISNMPGDDFDRAYADIIKKAVESLKMNRFACFVIGDYRDAKGLYRNLPGKTIAAFEAAGADLYNEAILVTATGTLAIRAGKSFRTTRKLGKTHQNVLVFVKGDPRKATEEIGAVDITGVLDPDDAPEAGLENASDTEITGAEA
jgi:DNA modification methylase